MHQSNEDQSCKQKLVLPQSFEDWTVKLGPASLTMLLTLYFEGLLLDANHFRLGKLQVFKEFRLTCVLETKRVQRVRESFSDLKYYPGKDNSNWFTASA